MQKQNQKPFLSLMPRHLMVMLSVLTLAFSVVPAVNADQYDDKINQLKSLNAQNQQAASVLQGKVQTYQQAIDQLQTEINAVESALGANQAKQADLKHQIAKAEAQLEEQKKLLGEDIRTMYVQGDMTPIEMLATSSNLSDYVDQQEYHIAVQNKVSTILDTINQLKAQLQKQKAEVDQLVKSEQAQQAELSAARAKQSQMLAYTQQQKANYESQIQSNNAQIAKLEAEQAAALAALRQSSGSSYHGSVQATYGTFEFRNLTSDQYCGGGYDYCWAGFDQSVSDTWGLGLARECVHYAADRAAKGLNLAPYLGAGNGNAEQWPSSLGGAYRVDHNPSGGHVVAIVAWPGGGGHAMYVESVLPDGWVHVSQMNWNVNGMYSEMDVKDSGVMFVHFP